MDEPARFRGYANELGRSVILSPPLPSTPPRVSRYRFRPSSAITFVIVFIENRSFSNVRKDEKLSAIGKSASNATGARSIA